MFIALSSILFYCTVSFDPMLSPIKKDAVINIYSISLSLGGHPYDAMALQQCMWPDAVTTVDTTEPTSVYCKLS